LPEVCRGKPGLPPGVYAGDVLMSNRLDDVYNGCTYVTENGVTWVRDTKGNIVGHGYKNQKMPNGLEMAYAWDDGFTTFKDAHGNYFTIKTEENMSDEYVKIKKENVLQAAEQCDTARDVLKALFPDLFESKLKYKVGDKVMIEGKITDTDDSDMPYAVRFPDGIDGWFSREVVEGETPGHSFHLGSPVFPGSRGG
jgi:hypothetical protein